MKKKVVSVNLCAAMEMTMVAGCGGGTKETQNAETPSATEATESAAKTETHI